MARAAVVDPVGYPPRAYKTPLLTSALGPAELARRELYCWRINHMTC